MRKRTATLLVFLIAAAVDCAPSGSTTVPLLTAAGIPVTYTPPREVPLEIVTRSTAVKDPLVVHGSDVSYADLEGALGHAITTATIPWAEEHVKDRPGGWQLSVEVIEAKAEYDAGRLIVTMNTRSTLRTRQDHVYLAQTQTPCREAGLTIPEKGAPVIYSCMSRIGRDLASWLGGVNP
jgi:bacillopeptidase F (M6 metalloprotease family)